MLIESTIVLVFVVIIFAIYMRKGKHGLAVAISPLGILPLFDLMGYFIQNKLPKVPFLNHIEWRILFIILGIVLPCILYGMICINIEKKSNRQMYLILCAGFTLIYGFGTLLNTLLPQLGIM